MHRSFPNVLDKPLTVADAVNIAEDYWRGDAMCVQLRNALRICGITVCTRLSAITHITATQWLTKLRKDGVSIATQRAYYSALRRCLSLSGVNVSLWPKSPTLPRGARREAIPAEELVRIMGWMAGQGESTYYLAELILATGMRGSEATEERGQGWTVKLSARTHDWVQVKGKGGHERDVTVYPSIGGHLLEFWRKRITERTLKEHREVWASCCDELAIESRLPTLHALRHVFATKLYERSKDLDLVRRQLGHVSAASTTGYITGKSPAEIAALLTGLDEEAS